MSVSCVFIHRMSTDNPNTNLYAWAKQFKAFGYNRFLLYAKLIHDISEGKRPPENLNENAIDAIATVLGAAPGGTSAGVLLNPGSISAEAKARKMGAQKIKDTIFGVSSTKDSFITQERNEEINSGKVEVTISRGQI